MATRLARRTLPSSFSSSPLIRTSTVDINLLDLFRSRRLASFSTTSSTKKLSAVVDAVNERKLPPELRVEQRIWHSMEEGQFENLPGKGWPLNLSTNPHDDPAEDTLYRILSKNGCAPEWLELNKEIRGNISQWRLALRKVWTVKCNGNVSDWTVGAEALKVQLHDINNKVFWYNLIVSFGAKCWD